MLLAPQRKAGREETECSCPCSAEGVQTQCWAPDPQASAVNYGQESHSGWYLKTALSQMAQYWAPPGPFLNDRRAGQRRSVFCHGVENGA